MKKIILILAIAVAMGAFLLWGEGLLTFEKVQKSKEGLRKFTEENYLLAVLAYVGAQIPTAFFVPGEILLVLLGGSLFGVFWGTIYTDVGMTLGATIAFLSARYLIGGWLQKKYEKPLKSFNAEMEKHGANYLLVLRIVPLLPFFIVNYLAGIAAIGLKRFVLTTALGVVPGAFFLTYIGQRLGQIDRPQDILSLPIYLALFALASFALLPVLISRRKNRRREPGP